MQMQVCPNCGEENPAKFRLCGYCGTALAEALPPQELRKTVTIIFSDLKGSTALGETIDPEALHEIKNRYFDAMADVLNRHGGKIEKYIGDAIMAVFGLPKVREDDALRGVRAALGMQETLHRINEDFQRGYGISLAARMGVNTGEVVATADPNADQRLADGDAVNVAARLEQAAPAMEVLIGDLTYQLVREHVDVEPVEPLTLKGKAEPVPAWRLIGLRSRSVEAPVHAAPMIGRDAELTQLREMLGEAVSTSSARLVTVIGDAGVGKSRLISEFVTAVQVDARVLRGRCLPYGEGITFWPLVEITRQAAGIEEDDTPEVAIGRLRSVLDGAGDEADAICQRVASAVGLSPAAHALSELFWGARKLIEVLAAKQPLVLVIDEVHAAEDTFLDLMEHLLDTAAAPVLLLASARPDLLEAHPTWGERTGARRLLLRPLSSEDTEQIVDRLLGKAGLAPSVRERIAQASEGNPLFAEQMVSMLVERGLVRMDGDRWVSDGDLSEMAIPPTINALLSARLDLLSREERAVIEPAAVIGLVFPEPAVEELVPDPVRAGVPGHLGTLNRKQLVRPTPDLDIFRFHNLLIRDAAYQSLLKRARAQLHEKFVVWAERVNRERDREMEFEEILGYHLEQAYRYRQDLGPLDDAGKELAVRAAVKLGNAGQRALARGDMPAASNLLGRAAQLRAADDPVRAELLVEVGEALMEQGEFDEASARLSEALETAEGIGDDRLAERAKLGRLWVDVYGSDTGGSSDGIAEARKAITAFEAAGDEAGLARAYRLLFILEAAAGRFAAAAEACERVVEHAERAGDARLVARGTGGYASVALHGPLPAGPLITRCEELQAQIRGDRKAEAVILGVLAQLRAMQGDFEQAREEYRRGKAMLDDLGPSLTAASTSTETYRVEVLAGDLEAAERELRRDYDALGALGETYFRSTVAGFLSHVLLATGRADEAAEINAVAETLTADDDQASQVLWRSARAKLLGLQGRHDEAAGMAAEALAIASTTDDLILQADAEVDAATVLESAGRYDEAATHWAAALDRYVRKEDLVSAERLRSRSEVGAAG
jgi:predicted ATPase/class 3 adenylate cyclase